MDRFLGLQWMEWFTLFIMVFTLGAPLFYLLYFYRKHTMDNLDCSKFEVFSTDPSLQSDELPRRPVSCQPTYLEQRPWWTAVNTRWLWVTLGIAAVYFLITIIAVIASRGIPSMRENLPI